MHRRVKDKIMYGMIGLATAFTVGVLLWIIGFVVMNGIGHINWDFITSNYDSQTSYVTMPLLENNTNKLGLELDVVDYEDSTYPVIVSKESGFPSGEIRDKGGRVYKIQKGNLIKRIGKKSTENQSLESILASIDELEGQEVQVKITKKGRGIYPMLMTTILVILVALAVACPIGIFAAIYLTEYAKPGKLVRIIRFATESLAGIPSIIYGLFGMIFFVLYLKMDYSLLAGALTLSIILLPVIVRQTEESLKAIPQSYREGSLGLGASKLQTIRKVVLPNALSGIVVAIILSIGRIVGESAALLLTAGTIAKIPNGLLSSGATLTVKAYAVAEEEGDIGMACAIGTIIIVLILVLNTLSKLVSKKLKKANA
ncbi:phosphate ABC transporter permease PstA [Vallitalea pronyensis]|uniref:Phosphate transport system permease protein PstA n=1 Tax=Vallitalea pronyensis TaxID=1348613 RepID=A0A8J8MJC2_9FIRM|nr:phosphate ABC transporter permease PstA [Vallitalea pronyensis]QUI22719.1 phosphate ABC transporter permease PstA [Vallitalea pronyensis]